MLLYTVEEGKMGEEGVDRIEKKNNDMTKNEKSAQQEQNLNIAATQKREKQAHFNSSGIGKKFFSIFLALPLEFE